MENRVSEPLFESAAARFWCKPLKPASAAHFKSCLQRLFTFDVEVLAGKEKSCDSGYAPDASSCEEANNVDTTTPTIVMVLVCLIA